METQPFEFEKQRTSDDYIGREDWYVEDMPTLLKDLDWLLKNFEFGPEGGGQMGFTCRPGAEVPRFDNIGSLRRFKQPGDVGRASIEESSFSEFVPEFKNTYFHHLYQTLPIPIGRMRLMKLPPKRCLSLHVDRARRWHIAMITNPAVFFFFDTPTGYKIHQIPADGWGYYIDAFVPHTVFNGHPSADRYHLLFS